VAHDVTQLDESKRHFFNRAEPRFAKKICILKIGMEFRHLLATIRDGIERQTSSKLDGKVPGVGAVLGEEWSVQHRSAQLIQRKSGFSRRQNQPRQCKKRRNGA
jgi:hypothetical protein